MKYLSVLAASALVCAALSSCNEKARLAGEVEGVWSGSPERIADASAAYSSMVKTFDFQVDDSGEGGTVIITALIDVQNTVPSDGDIVQPIEVSAAATATVTGTWRAIDDDEMLISLDAASTQINVDPKAVQLNYNVLDSESAPDTSTLKPAAAAVIGRQVSAAVTSNILTINKIDDIKVHDNTLMECEINDHDNTLHRTPGV